ncbi:MAG TPA: HAMP domain-containing sensor histidine kinase [Anaerolineales bacterium]|nr:HAMP domain-containing sensor histidine kinase [Anaerolineales bacterium]
MTTRQISFPTQIDLERFVSASAHDLRTPFNHIIGFSKMTLNTVGDNPLTDYQKEDLATIYRSGMRALTLVNGIIDIARLNREEKDVSLSDILPESLLSQGLAQWKKFNPGNNAKIEYQVPSGPVSIRADELLMRQVIVGFIGFVILFCEANTEVTIRAWDEPARFNFSFASSGTKARQPSELDIEMIGFVNRRIVELHAGEIQRAEENDDGAFVQFSLPMAAPIDRP